MKRNILSLAIIATALTVSSQTFASVDEFKTTYTLDDIKSEFMENPFAVFLQADEVMSKKNPDYKKALMLFERASKLGVAQASHNAGLIYYEGLAGDVDYAKAAQYFYVAASEGIVESQMLLADMYTHELGLKINLQEAYKWYYLAAKQGVLKAKYYIGNMVYYGKGTSMDTDAGMAILMEAAQETQNRKAVFEIAEIHRQGINTPRDYSTALMYHEQAAKLGYVKSQEIAGDMHLYGQGTKENKEKAFYWYMMASEQGKISAMSKLGDMYLYAFGINQDTEKAMEWYKNSASYGDAHSMYQMASIFMKEEHGVKRDYKLAVDWYKKAVNSGHKEAMRELAIIYRKGIKGVMDANDFRYKELMNLYYKAVPKVIKEPFNLFEFDDDQSAELKKEQDFYKKDFEQFFE